MSGAGLGWWLAFGEHILSLGSGAEMGTAIGSGALLAVGSIRWAVGKWERAKGRWARDSARIGQGLTRDLRVRMYVGLGRRWLTRLISQGTVQRVVDEKVIIVASTAREGVQDLVNRRRNEISQLHGELCDLDAELRTFAQFPGAPASRTDQSPRPEMRVDKG